MSESVTEFLRMGGYAFYVWWSYAVVFVVLAINLVAPSVRHRRVRRALARELRVPEHRPERRPEHHDEP